MGVDPKTEPIEWYVLRGENRFGPFEYVELVRMLQEKKLFDWDYVWQRDFESWQKVSEIKDFKPETIKALRTSHLPELSEIFFRRRHLRAHYGTSLVVHNSKKLWRGESIEIGSGGVGFILESDELTIGQNLFLHFKPGDGVPPFNAICKVVSRTPHLKKYRYGVQFTSLNQGVRMAIKQYVENKAA